MPGRVPIAQLNKHLTLAADAPLPPGVTLEPFTRPTAVDDWLRIHHECFQSGQGMGRAWDRNDLERELLQKPWWNPDRTWLCYQTGHYSTEWLPVGTVTWGNWGRAPHEVPALQWLAVIPSARRLGVGKALVQTVERGVFLAGHRTLRLETHRDWTAAMALYQSLGYRES